MNPFFRRILGVTLAGTAALGLLLCLFGLVAVWRVKIPLTASLNGSLDLAANSLEITSQGLALADQSLLTATASAATMQTTVETLSKSISDTTPILISLNTLMGVDLPDSVHSAQSSLSAAQQGAAIIDGMLRALTSLPFVPKDLYNPPVPLQVGLGQVSNSLNGLPDTFTALSASLETTQGNMRDIKENIQHIADDVGEITASLQDAQDVVHQYQGVVKELQARVTRVQDRLPGWMNGLAWGFTIVILWLGLTQIGLLLQAADLMGQKSA
jgi:uncharacterized phage infection (PIP) family protein YhgE